MTLSTIQNTPPKPPSNGVYYAYGDRDFMTRSEFMASLPVGATGWVMIGGRPVAGITRTETGFRRVWL